MSQKTQFRSAIHTPFNKLQAVYMAIAWPIAPRKRSSSKYSGFVLLNPNGKRLELGQGALFHQAKPCHGPFEGKHLLFVLNEEETFIQAISCAHIFEHKRWPGAMSMFLKSPLRVDFTQVIPHNREISLCVRHGVRLQTSCPNCARSQPHLAWRSRLGYCALCAWTLFGEQVERQEPIDPETPEFAWQRWVLEALGTLVAQLPSIQKCPGRERIQLAVNHAVKRLTDGNIAAFARLLDLPRNTVENWSLGKRVPELDMLLRLCYRLNLPLDEVLFQEADELQPDLQDPIPEARFRNRKRTAIDKERIFHLLEKAASKAEYPPPSLQEVGQWLGYQPTTLYKINRVACHAIVEHFTAYRQELREKRLQGYREEIRQIALLLQAEKVALTRLHIARYLTQPAILRDPTVRILLSEVCREVELHPRDTLG